jgi:hypothetical protein
VAIGRHTLQLILDAAQSIRSARDLDQTIDRVGRTAQSTAQRADTGFRRLEAALTGAQRSARAADDQLSRVNRTLRTGGESVDVMAARLRVAGREMENYARRVSAAEERQRRLNESMRGGGGALGGLGSALGGGFRDYALGAFAGGVSAAAVTAVVDRLAQFTRESVQAYVEGSRAQVFLETSAKRAGLTVEQTTSEVRKLRREFFLSQTDAESSLATALRVARQANRPELAGELLRATLTNAAAAGINRERVPDLLRQLGTGEDEATDLLLGIGPTQIYQRAALRAGRSVGSFTDEEKRLLRILATIDEARNNQGAVQRYRRSGAGFFDQVSAVAADANRAFGAGIAGPGTIDAIGTGAAGVARGLNVYLGNNAAVERFAQQLIAARPSSRPPTERFDPIADAGKSFQNYVQNAAVLWVQASRTVAAAQIADWRRIADERETLDRTRSVNDPFAGIRFRYEDRRRAIDEADREREIRRLYGAQADEVLATGLEPGTDRRVFVPQTANARELTRITREGEAVEIGRARREITRELSQQLDQLRAQYTGQSNPLKQILLEGEIQAKSLHEQLKKYGPEFSAQARQIEAEAARLRLPAFADALAASSRGQFALDSRIREIADSPYGEAALAVPQNEALRDSRAVRARSLRRILDQIGGRSLPGGEYDEQDELFRDASGAGGANISPAAALERLADAAEAGRIDQSRITIDQQSLLSRAVSSRYFGIQGIREPESPQERIARAFSAAAKFATDLESTGKYDEATIETKRRGYILDALAGTAASDYARSPQFQAQYLQALTKERDEQRTRDAEAIGYAKRTAEALERLTPADGTPSKVAGAAGGETKVSTDVKVDVTVKSKNPLVDAAVDGTPLDLTNVREAVFSGLFGG